jgi:malonyl CoA-acyl carrier protein transacylase
MYTNHPIAIVGLGAIMPDAQGVNKFWQNILDSTISISEVPASRWLPGLYYHPDRKVLDKSYSKIGSFVQQYTFEPLQWKIPIPPNVQKAMDHPQKWAIACTHQALLDYGYPQRAINTDRTAVIFGNALAGELHYTTTLRIRLPEFIKALEETSAFQGLPANVQQTLRDEAIEQFNVNILPITEDTMPGELSNVIAGRVANVFNLHGPNFITDAACASSLAAMQSAMEGLNTHRFDAAITGGIDSGMGIEAYVKFSKIGALSPDGSRPYDATANGFVMGEGAAVFLLKRLEDAERDQDNIYAVIRGIGSSSDGAGKGITAPNPVGQVKAITRAWENAGVNPASVGMIEGHGTSTRVGDVVEVNALFESFQQFGLPTRSVALGSVKSNIGHLKSAAGAAGMLKAVMALHHKTLPPSANYSAPNPDIPFDRMPFYVNTLAQPWQNPPGEIRRAGISSFGFGGTNFHVVLEEYVPGLSEGSMKEEKIYLAAAGQVPIAEIPEVAMAAQPNQEVAQAYILELVSEKTGYPVEMLDLALDLEADLGIDTVKQAELFAAVREHFNIPRLENLRLSDYNTLERVIEFVVTESPQQNREETELQREEKMETPELPQFAEADAAEVKQDVEAFILAMISEKTGYPSEVLDLQLDLEADLGVDTVKQAEMFLNIREHYNIERQEDLRLSDYNTIEKVIQFVVNSQRASQPAQAAGGFSAKDSYDQAVDLPANVSTRQPLRGLLFIGEHSQAELVGRLQAVLAQAEQGLLPPNQFPDRDAVARPERMAIDYENAPDLVNKIKKTIQALSGNNPKTWFALAGQGIRYTQGAMQEQRSPGKLVFMFPGQGSQYINMLRDLVDLVPVVRETYAQADAIMAPILGKPLTDYIFVEGDESDQTQGKEALKNTIITQPAVLTCNVALLRMLADYGYQPDMVVGHSLGEYAALVAAGVMPFEDALRVVSARGQEMSKTGDGDGGCMVAVTAPLANVQKILDQVEGYAVIANINSPMQSVIGGSTPAIEQALAAFTDAGYQAVKIPVSQAFHTRIVEPASQPLRNIIAQMRISEPTLPVVANVTGSWYPQAREDILDILASQVHSPVQFTHCIQTLYDAGGRVFVEVGPKRVLNVLAAEILQDKADIHVVATNHPRKGGLASFNETLACLLAAGIPMDRKREALSLPVAVNTVQTDIAPVILTSPQAVDTPIHELTGSVLISGTGLGLPGKGKPVFAEDNVERLLNGDSFIDPIPEETRQQMLDKSVIRLQKSEAGAQMIELNQMEQTIKLAGQPGTFDLAAEYGLPPERVSTFDISTQLAIAAGIEALREAGIPLVMSYKKTTLGTYIPDRWRLPESMADETGVIFASAFPGLARMADELDTYHAFKTKQEQLSSLQTLLPVVASESQTAVQQLQSQISAIEAELAEMDYHLDRNFVFRVLTMGHSQFAEYIGARGPNTHVNGACASTTQAIGVAEDWIRTGRCRRVIVIAGDDVASGSLMHWIGSALMASGAATTEGELRLAALPFDRRRNGMIIGMGAAALVVESQDAVAERGMTGICEILASEFANSAFHGTRLEVQHVSDIMVRLLKSAETRFNLQREALAPRLVFVSHETYTPARGGSASAEIYSLRHTFGESADQVIIANTKGFTGHSMGVGVEDVLAIKALELGKVPPIANLDAQFEADPQLGDLNLSRGGNYHPDYALRLGAGFGSQLAMTLYRRIPNHGSRINQAEYNTWLAAVTGYANPETQVQHRTYRVKDTGAPVNPPRASLWEFGQKPMLWAAHPEDKRDSITVEEGVLSDSTQAVSRIQISLPDEPLETHHLQEAPVMQRLQVEPIKDFCLDLISNKTGYPVEMLELELDLEADLGIDTVKQAEVFAELREHYQLPRPDDLRLSDYNTIGKVINFLVSQADGDIETSSEPADNTVSQPELEPAIELVISRPVENKGVNTEEIQDYLLALVSEKTGYPTEMLDIKLDLEADLGVDTVKQAELFAAVREHYDIPRQENLVLSDYNTLEKVIQFVQEAVSGQQETAEQKPVETDSIHLPEKPAPVITRRIPVPVMRPKLSLCMPTGVQLQPGDHVLVVSDGAQSEGSRSIGDRLTSRLNDLGVSVQHITTGENLAAGLTSTCKGIFLLTGWSPLREINPLQPSEMNDRLEQSLYQLFRLIQSQGESQLSFMISATQTGGLHGYDPSAGALSLIGALAGFSKSLAREQTDTLVKVVDFEVDINPEIVVERLLAELESDPDVVEIGWHGDERYTILALPDERKSQQNLSLGSDSVFLVSGGAGGIIIPVVKDLAERTAGTFILFGRTQPPSDWDHPQLKQVLADRAGLKQAMIQQASLSQEKINPAQIEEKLALLESQARIQQALAAVFQAGGKAAYYACDVTDQSQVDALVKRVADQYGRIDVLIHAAGVEKSRLIKNKTEKEFRQVFEVKVMGFLHLIQSLVRVQALPHVNQPLQAVQVFSSVAGRFGNPGQADYAAANDTLCRWITALQKQVPGTQFQALDWSAWDEVGMAARGFVPALMQRAGIEMLPVSSAAPQVAEELLYGGPGECILAGQLGALEEQLVNAGGLDLEQASQAMHRSGKTPRLFDSVVASNLADGITLAGTLDPTREGFLQDHALRGIAVMPGVMGIEGFVTAAEFVVAELLSGHDLPGEPVQTGKGTPYRAYQVSKVHFKQPLKFYRNEPRQVLWKVNITRQDDTLVAHVSMQSVMKTRLGETKVLDHFSGQVHLAQEAFLRQVQPSNVIIPSQASQPEVAANDIYQLYFHGPSFQVLQGVSQQNNLLLGRCQFTPQEEVRRLLDAASQPLLVESCFQTAGVWDIGCEGRFSLPQSIGSLSLYPNSVNGNQIYTCVKPRQHDNNQVSFDAYVVDDQGNIFLEMQDYQTSPLTTELGETSLKPFKAVFEDKLG